LAELSPLKYDKERSAAARELGVSVGGLDRAVKEARAARSETKGQGRPQELPLIEPWHLPVNGGELLDEICGKIRRYVVLPEGSAPTQWRCGHCIPMFLTASTILLDWQLPRLRKAAERLRP
jgi:hypothetical protein